MNSSEDLSDKIIDSKKKVKFSGRKKKDKQEWSSGSSGEEDGEDFNENSPNLSNNRASTSNIGNNSTNSNIYGNIYRKYRKRHVWEVMEGYRDPNMKISQPANYEGILLKRRNWPMKGWHKRYFMLVDGILSYGKTKTDITKNKLHGTVNTFFSIVSYITSSRRILIDFSTQSNAFVCHLKAKTQSDFEQWIEHLKHHRRFYQYKFTQSTNTSQTEIGAFSRQSSVQIQNNSSQNTSITISNLASLQQQSANIFTESPNSYNLQSISESDKVKKSTILSDSELAAQLKQTENNLINLSKVLGFVTLSNGSQSNRNSVVSQVNNINNNNKNVTSPKPQPHHHQQASSVSFDYLKTNKDTAKNLHVSKSNPNLIKNQIIDNEFLAANIINTGTIINHTKHANNNGNDIDINNKFMVGPLPAIILNDASNISISSSMATNDDESFRLNFYNDAKSINDQLNFIYQQLLVKQQLIVKAQKDSNIDVKSNLSRAQRSQSVLSSLSLQDSQVQFYDAIEYLTSESESDDSDDGSDDGSGSAPKPISPAIVPEELQAQKMLTRRRNLPAPAPDTSQVSIWGILRKAIGKDLSKIAMPVILNEPLGILQKLCEELEYSELLDAANLKQDPYDRMVMVAAFIISGYASSYYRNGNKNFNPLLGETYELIRPDKGWKYVSEQVSHHPPISATYCQSKAFIHEQIFHAKIKFWGRSMEVHPEGYTRLTLPKFDETYQWNKIVMYVSNLTGSERRIEQTGEITIRCTNGVSCTITFPKASYSSQKNEFFGDVIFDNVVKRKIFGQWHEAFLCGTDNTAKTIWRMGAMPEDANLYYGFTRFAIELNEFTESLKEELPPTDSRFRPDQRLFENGDVDKAEIEKQRIEESQRARRRELEAKGEHHHPLWFTQDKENAKTWDFNHQYWNKRESPGYKSLKNIFPALW